MVREVNAVNSDYTTTSANQIFDTFNAATLRTAKYIIQIEHDSDSKYQAKEVLLTHNGSTVFMNEYGTVGSTDSDLASIDADITGGQVRLKITPTYTNTDIKAKRITLGA